MRRSLAFVAIGAAACRTSVVDVGMPVTGVDAAADNGGPAVAIAFLGVAAAGGHTCALGAGGGPVWCWGRNMSGELGDPDPFLEAFQPRKVEGTEGTRWIAAGGDVVDGGSTCLVTAAATVSCFGVIVGTWMPTAIAFSDVTALAVSDRFGCALLADRTVACWGDNEFGQLGIGTSGGSSPKPIAVTGLANVIAISAGESGDPSHTGAASGGHVCALREDQTAWCWGSGGNGQLGNGLRVASSSPVQVTGLGPIASVRAGGESVGGDKGHTCAALVDGTAACWGTGWAGQLGDGLETASATPVAVSGLTQVVDVAVGGTHSCALRHDGTVWCWGNNSHGQLGTGTMIPSAVPVQVAGLSDVTGIEAGSYHNCVRLANGTIRCWGLGDMGQIGDGVKGDHLEPAAPVFPAAP